MRPRTPLAPFLLTWALAAGCVVSDYEPGGMTCSSDEACPAPYSCLEITDGRRCLLQQAFQATEDTFLKQGAPDTSQATNTVLNADGDDAPQGSTTGLHNFILIRFDLTAVSSTDLPVRAVALEVDIVNPTIGEYPLRPLLRSWNEQSTWNHVSPGVTWEVAGAQGPSDRAESVLGTVGAKVIGPYKTWLNAAGVVQVRQWIAASSGNHGFHLGSDQFDSVLISSREASELTLRPRLVLYWP
jgi:hypothetical protein